MKFTLPINRNGECRHEYPVYTEHMKTRNGFAHIAKTYSADGTEIVNKVSYCNRTWESYPYQTAIHGLIDRVVQHEYGCPSDQSFRKAKKWSHLREIAKDASIALDHPRY